MAYTVEKLGAFINLINFGKLNERNSSYLLRCFLQKHSKTEVKEFFNRIGHVQCFVSLNFATNELPLSTRGQLLERLNIREPKPFSKSKFVCLPDL